MLVDRPLLAWFLQGLQGGEALLLWPPRLGRGTKQARKARVGSPSKKGKVNDRFSGHRFSGNDHFSGQIIQKTTVLEENEPVLFTGLEDTTALEDKKRSDRFFR